MDDDAGSDMPKDYIDVVNSIEVFVRQADLYLKASPPQFDAILHHLLLFGEMWEGPPDLSKWGVKGYGGQGQCSANQWRSYFDQDVLWAPDFVSLISRYSD